MSLLDRSLGEQAAAIAAGEAAPGELLDAALRRIEERNPAVNAIVETFPERSREMLDAAPDGPLRGVPVAVKDEWPLPWRAQRFGAAKIFTRTQPGESGPFRALRDAGAVIIGVANMHEWGSRSTGDVSVYGPARNPWNTDHCPGGSSSGPAAAVAARLVAGSVGADGLGSIRYPAAYCGLTGLKPTFGRSAMQGHHMDGLTTTIVSGPLCADAADCRLLGSVLRGEEILQGDAAGLRIGVVKSAVWDDCAPEVREACEQAVGALRDETGGEVRSIEIEGLDLAPLAAVLIGTTEGLGGITPQMLNDLGEEIGILNRALVKYQMLLPAAAVKRAARVRTMMRRVLAAAFSEVDVLAWPTVPAVAPPLADTDVDLPSGRIGADPANVRAGGLANLTGVPGINLPVGLSGGLPIGLQLMAAWDREAVLLDAAEALERANGRRWVEARPPLAETTSAPA